MKTTELEIAGQLVIVTGPMGVYLKDRGKKIKTSQGSTVATIRYPKKGSYALSNHMKDRFNISTAKQVITGTCNICNTNTGILISDTFRCGSCHEAIKKGLLSTHVNIPSKF